VRGERKKANPPKCINGIIPDEVWLKTKVTYKLTCDMPECQHTPFAYIGESKKPLEDRVREHAKATRMNNVKATAFAEHFKQCHPCPVYPILNQKPIFKIEVLDSKLDYVKRKINEAVKIDAHKPNLNRRTEGNKCQHLLYWHLDKAGRDEYRQGRSVA